MVRKVKEEINAHNKVQGQRCFGCDSSFDIKSFQINDKKAEHIFRSNVDHATGHGLVHGAVIFTALDEAMFRTVEMIGIQSVTVDSKISYLVPVNVGDELFITTNVGKIDGRNVLVKAVMKKKVNKKKIVVCKARANFLKVSDDFFKKS